MLTFLVVLTFVQTLAIKRNLQIVCPFYRDTKHFKANNAKI